MFITTPQPFLTAAVTFPAKTALFTWVLTIRQDWPNVVDYCATWLIVQKHVTLSSCLLQTGET